MKENCFSVVITTKDRLSYLERALLSILNSTKLPSEIIIVNDGGAIPTFTDVSNSGVDIVFLNFNESRGANYCRNQGIIKANNDKVFLLDDDDSVTSSSFESRMKVTEKNKNFGIVFTGINIILSSNLEKVVRVVPPKDSYDYYKSLFINGNVIGSTSRVLLSKKAFQNVGMFDENLKSLQDYELWLRIAEIFSVHHDNSIGVNYTVHDTGTQISSSYTKYIESADYIKNKYSTVNYKLYNKMVSNLYLRVAISAAHSSVTTKIKYILKSNEYSVNFKSLALLLPYKFLKKIRPFI